jgi:hypothetical protein
MRKNTVENFWKRVDKNGPVVRPELGPCWVWVGKHYPTGYGQFVMGKERYAHRHSWAFASGDAPGAMCVCHKCDNPACVRPGHLFLGTHADNVRDRDRKGRGAGGERISDAAVRMVRPLRESGLTFREIGLRLGMSGRYASMLARGEWRRRVA